MRVAPAVALAAAAGAAFGCLQGTAKLPHEEAGQEKRLKFETSDALKPDVLP